jgi:hypothetical protein
VSNKRSWSTFALLAVAIVSLVVGSVGTASAGGLTKGAVKKIAAKVVKKQAGHLHVADADTVGGLPASALQERRVVYTVPVTSGMTSMDAVLPLAPGTYEVSYSIRLKSTNPSTSACWIYRFDSDALEYLADDGASAPGSEAAHSGSGVVTVAAGQSVALGCQSDQPFTTTAIEPGQVVVTPLAGVTRQTLTAVVGP